MKFGQPLLVVSLVLGLAGCASYSSSYQSDVVYRDGSYYSPAGDGDGDYYYAPEPRDDYYHDYYGQDFFYGGGYCSVRYSYCPPFWYSQFLAPPFGYIITSGDNGWYDPWGGGFGYGYYYPSPYYYNGRRHGGHDRDRDHDRDHDGDARPAPAAIGSTGSSTSDAEQAPIRRFRGPGDSPRAFGSAEAAAEIEDGGQPRPWRQPGAMPTPIQAPMRRRYPTATPMPMPPRARLEPRWIDPEPPRADPTPESWRSPSSDSASGDERRGALRRGQDE